MFENKQRNYMSCRHLVPCVLGNRGQDRSEREICQDARNTYIDTEKDDWF